MKKTFIVGLALAIVGAGAAFFIISSSNNPNAPDNVSRSVLTR